MKPTLFAASVAIILLTSATSNAGNGYFNQLGRNLGYGISDGYHAQRSCQTVCMSCNNCSPVQQPMMQQPMVAPAYSPWSPHQFQQVGYPAAPMYPPWYQPIATGLGQPVMPPVASPNRSPTSHW